MIRKKTAVLMEKFCDLNPSLGLTSGYSNIVGSLISSGLSDVQVFHYDEYFINHGRTIDEFLLSYLRNDKPDYLIVSYYPFWDHRNVALETFGRILEMGIPISTIWFDFGHASLQNVIGRVSYHVTLNIIIDTFYEDNLFIPMWVPQEETIFTPGYDKDIEISFVGTVATYQTRQTYLNFLQRHRNVCISGGQREHRLTMEQYAEILRKSKITLNFPDKPDGTVQAKCRIYEAMLSRALLLEKDNEAIKRWFEPMVHYIPFGSPQDMLDKVSYYVANNQERERIVENAYQKMRNDYSSKSWWNKVFGELDKRR